MKFTALMAAFSLVLCGNASSETGIRLNAGMSRVSYDDYNKFVDEVNKSLSSIGLELEKLHWLPEIQGEFIYSPLPLITVGAGAGMLFGKAELSSGLIGQMEYGVKTYPITVTGYFKPDLPLMPVKPYAFFGLGMYYSKINFELDQNFVQGVSESADMTTWGFGFHGGAGLEFSILPALSLELGVRARWAELKGFEGTGTDANGDPVDVFLVSDEILYQGNYYPAFGPLDVAEKDKYNEGALDLSGYGFSLGLKFAF
jgi:hypothetical protein